MSGDRSDQHAIAAKNLMRKSESYVPFERKEFKRDDEDGERQDGGVVVGVKLDLDLPRSANRKSIMGWVPIIP